jgi:hypothetical protein
MAAIRWVPRRAAHVLFAGVVVGMAHENLPLPVSGCRKGGFPYISENAARKEAIAVALCRPTSVTESRSLHR